MPAKLDKCVKAVKKTGKETSTAFAICKSKNKKKRHTSKKRT